MDPAKTQTETEIIQQVAEAVRAACIAAALDGYEMAAMNGLCHEGAWEAAVSAMQTLRVADLVPTIHRQASALADQTSSR